MSTSQQHTTEGAGMTAGETRIHDRLDEMSGQLAELTVSVAEINTKCGPCSDMVKSLNHAVKGNSKPGLETDVAVLKKAAKEAGGPETVSIAGMGKLIGYIVAGTATIAGAVGAAVAAVAAAFT